MTLPHDESARPVAGPGAEDGARFRALAENAFDLICEVDEALRLTYVCPQVTDHLAYRPDALLGEVLTGYVHPDDRLRAAAWLRDALVRPVHPAAFRLHRQDGRWNSYEISGSRYESDSGWRVVLVGRDVSERHDEDLHAVLNHLQDAVVVLDRNLRARYLNPAMASMLGYTVDELLRLPASAVTHPDDFASTVARDFRRVAGEDVPRRNRLRLLHRDGRVITTDVFATLYVRDGVVRGTLSEFRDITDQVAAQEALAAGEQRYRQLFELVQDGLFFTDPAGRPLLANDAFCRMLGYTRDEVMRRDRFDFVHPEERALVEAGQRERAEGSHATRRFPRRLVRKDGTTVYTETQVASLFEDGEYVGVLGVHTDVTDRMALEREAAEQRERAQRAALREQFMATVNHELRTPLTSIVGFGELLELGVGGGQLTEQQREYIDEIVRAGSHLLQLINDLLDMSKLEAARVEIHPVETDAAGIVREVVRALGPLARAGNVRVRADLDSAPPLAMVDPRAFRQVVTNLLSNAVKFSRNGTVAVSLRRRGDQVVLMVEDTGIGIPAENLERIFEPFTQGETGLDRTYGGTGLGLTIAEGLVGLHGGQIVLCSAPGMGTAVRVSLPLHSAPALATA